MISILLFLNFLILLLLWAMGCILVSVPYNHFIQYAETAMPLPVFTAMIISVRYQLAVVPFCGGAAAAVLGYYLRQQNHDHQTRSCLLFTLSSLALGLSLLLCFLLAAFLPYLRIGALL